jgi:hypothetical protein
MYLNIIKNTILFSIFDYFLTKYNVKGTYYFNHFLANLMVIYYTLPQIFLCYFDFNNAILIPTNYSAIEYIFSIHYYHILYYFYKLRFDDWLHHILMIFVALPLSLQTNSGAILSHSVFFLTGLPGCIDYFLLFLNRNNLIDKSLEKKVNNYLNLWIRCPGCISSSTLIFQNLGKSLQEQQYLQSFYICLIGAIIYWNGIYFMEQVVSDYTLKYRNIKKIEI